MFIKNSLQYSLSLKTTNILQPAIKIPIKSCFSKDFFFKEARLARFFSVGRKNIDDVVRVQKASGKDVIEQTSDK